VLGLCADKTPNLVALQTADANPAHVPVMVFSASLTRFNEQFSYGIYGDIREATCGSKAITFNKHS
jgi:hypothetical protein